MRASTSPSVSPSAAYSLAVQLKPRELRSTWMDERGLTVSAWATISAATAALLPNQRNLDLTQRSLRLHQVEHEILSGRRCDPRARFDEVGVGAEQFFACVGELGMTGALG